MRDILLTGASGFLGSIILKELGAENVITLGRSKSDIVINLDLDVPVIPVMKTIIHCIGKAHAVPKTALQKQEFFNVNVTGTLNLLRAIENSNSLPKSFVFISSVAVYGKESGLLIQEESPLEAKDAYGLSKIQAERIIQQWCNQNNVICTILRLPLLAGPNPPGNLGNMISAIRRGYYFDISGGTAKKSIVLAKDVARIIKKAADRGGIYNLTDGYHPSFSELSLEISRQLNKRKPLNMPKFIAYILSLAGDVIGGAAPINTKKLNKITSDLTFDDSKAKQILDWTPNSVLSNFQIK